MKKKSKKRDSKESKDVSESTDKPKEIKPLHHHIKHHYNKYKESPNGIKILVLYSLFLALMYLILGLLFPVTIIFGHEIHGKIEVHKGSTTYDIKDFGCWRGTGTSESQPSECTAHPAIIRCSTHK